MNTKQQIEADLKTAMLAGDKTLVTTLRGLKSSILNVEIEKGLREEGLEEQSVIALLQKEAKKRQESADLYKQGGNEDKFQAELEEKKVIEKYLPEQLSQDEILAVINQAIIDTGATSAQDMGKVIGLVKQKVGVTADGSLIAKLTKEKLA